MVSKGFVYAVVLTFAIVGAFYGAYAVPWMLNNPIALGPWLTWNDDPSSSVVISWWTAVEDNSYVFIKNSTWNATYWSNGTRVHHVKITGLVPEQEYKYFVNSTGADLINVLGGPFSFTLVSKTRESFKFLVFADRAGWVIANGFSSVVSAMLRESNISFVVGIGDYVNGPLIWDEWKAFLTEAKPLISRYPFIPAVGNHDHEGVSRTGGGDGGAKFYELMSLPGTNGSFVLKIANVNIVIFACNTSHYPIPDAQLDWLNSTLRSLDGLTFVFFHVPVKTPNYTPLSFTPSSEKMWQILTDPNNHVSAVFQGHDHLYARWMEGNIPFVIAGGNGELDPYAINGEICHHYIRAEINGNSAVFTVLRVDGTVVDTFSVQR